MSSARIEESPACLWFFNFESHDKLDRIIMAGLPMAHYLEIKGILPVREYERFSGGVKGRCQ